MAALAIPLTFWWITNLLAGPTGPAGYAIVLLPMLFLLRAWAGARTSSIVTGLIVALCFVGVAGLGFLFAPFGIATIFLEARDISARSLPALRAVALTAAAFMVTFVTIIVSSSAYYQTR